MTEPGAAVLCHRAQRGSTESRRPYPGRPARSLRPTRGAMDQSRRHAHHGFLSRRAIIRTYDLICRSRAKDCHRHFALPLEHRRARRLPKLGLAARTLDRRNRAIGQARLRPPAQPASTLARRRRRPTALSTARHTWIRPFRCKPSRRRPGTHTTWQNRIERDDCRSYCPHANNSRGGETEF